MALKCNTQEVCLSLDKLGATISTNCYRFQKVKQNIFQPIYTLKP